MANSASSVRRAARAWGQLGLLFLGACAGGTACAATGGAAAATAAAATAATAASTEHWAATATRAHDPRGATHLGALRAGEQVPIVIALKLRDQAGLDALTAALLAGNAGVRPLSRDEFMERHAPTGAQADAVAAYLRAQGFSDIEVADNRLLVSATGGAGVIRKAFHADLHAYETGGRSAFANLTDAEVPAHLSALVLGVVGLQTVHLAHVHAQVLTSDAQQAPAQTPTQPEASAAVSAIAMANFPAIYGASTLAAATNTSIGIITQGSVAQTVADLKAFAAAAGYPVPAVTTSVVGSASADTSGLVEWNMDSQSALAAAGGSVKSVILYNVNSLSDANLTKGYNKAVSDNLAKVINVSLGGCENDEKGVEAAQDAIFQAAVAQGQTFSVSSGDSGAFECGTGAKAQSYPAASPYVMAIGGTTLSTAGGTAWGGETTWACTTAANCQQSSAGGAGGGPSLTEAAPAWQIAAGVLGGATRRGVPDIALDASPYSGALVLVNGRQLQIGGTSLAAPLFAGFWARIQSANNNSLPFPAPTLYAGAAAHPAWFHDVTSGAQGYGAAVGWDYATGYGSLQVANFAAAFTSSASTGPIAAFGSSSIGLTASFTDASTDSGSTINAYAWNFGDGATSTTRSPTHTYAAAGSYSVTESVADANGRTAARSASVSVTGPATVVATQLLANAGFEDPGAGAWTLSLGVLCRASTCTGEAAHAGDGFAWFDGYGVAHVDSAAQSVALAAGKTSALLSFYLHVDTRETGLVANDTFKVQLYNAAGTLLATLATYSNLNAASGYALKSFNLAPYIGQTLSVRFTGSENASKPTSFILDDVTLTVQ